MPAYKASELFLPFSGGWAFPVRNLLAGWWSERFHCPCWNFRALDLEADNVTGPCFQGPDRRVWSTGQAPFPAFLGCYMLESSRGGGFALPIHADWEYPR